MHDPLTETVDGPVRHAPPDGLCSGTIVDDRYEIVRVLGQGGSAVVYAAYDRVLNLNVALKVLRCDRITETAVKRLRREVAVAREAADPRLVRVFDIGEAGAAVYLTMELVDAPTLQTWMRGRRLEVEQVIRLGTEVIEAIQALHALGIVHRDIKPSNLLLGADGHIKLGDFGLALHLDPDESRLTQTAGFVGTAEYLSPEQALGADVDQRSDLYSFGILLFEMLTGRVPFESESSIGAVVARMNRPAPDVRTLRRDCPRWLAKLVGVLLEKDPSKRFATADAVRFVLQTRRVPIRRELPGLRVAAVVVLLSLAASSGSYFWFRHRFARLVTDGATTISAIDRGGRLLWSMHDVNQQLNTVLLRERGSLRYVAVIRDTGSAADLARNHDLLLVDPQSGAIVRKTRLPDQSVVFPDFSREFHITSIGSADLHGNGDDLVVATYCHGVYWPSYTVAYDPRSQTAGTIFIGSGHHHYLGAADVNSDGRKDVILAGINNRMGWPIAVAAIDVRTGPYGYEIASSPDANYVPPGGRALLWYSLLPAGHGLQNALIDQKRKTISINYADGRVETIDFNGFPLRNYRRPLQVRIENRQKAYRELREAVRLSAGGFLQEAAAAAQRASRDAIASEDPVLIEWARRTDAMILVRSGKFDDAEREFEAVASVSESPPEIAFDAGQAFHLAGQLNRAIAWYNRGLGVRSNAQTGRGKYEFLEGEVLALGQLNRWDDALRAIQRFEAEFAERPYPAAYRQYVEWRLGERIEKPVDVTGSKTDLLKYWNLEILHHNGMRPAALLPEIDRENLGASGQVLLRSLRGEVLAQLGRPEDAYEAARKAYQAALVSRGSDTAILAHFDLIATRFAARARAAGHAGEALDAERQMRHFQR